MRPKYRYTSRKGGLLADEMGLGKTVQVAAFLSAVLGKSATSEDKRRTFPLPEGDCRQVPDAYDGVSDGVSNGRSDCLSACLSHGLSHGHCWPL